MSFAVAGCDGAFDLERVPVVDGPPDGPPFCLEDRFDSLDLTRWNVTGLSDGVTVSAMDTLQIGVPASTTSAQDPYGSVQSLALDLTGATIEVELVVRPPDGATSEVALQIQADDSSHYDILVGHSTLTARTYIGGVIDNLKQPFVAARHRFLRFRVEAGELVFETRAVDGAPVELRRVPTAVTFAAAELAIYAGSYDVAAAFTAELDNLTIVGTCSK